jgi:hypothetical protein
MRSDARSRLIATAVIAENNKSTDPDIANKQRQIENLKKSLPSRQNRRSMSQTQRLNTRKQILNLQDQIVDIRLKNKSKEERT